jgi:pimeloyl-ACP methyl ester carboxylesterase
MPKAYVNGTSLYYSAKGEGEPLLLMQGFAGGHRGWFLQMRAFARKYRVVTSDTRGIVRKGDAAKDYTLKTLADDTVGLMDYLGIEKAHMLGVSMGGMIAQQVAMDYPERVMRLVLACTLADADRPYTDEETELLAGHCPKPRYHLSRVRANWRYESLPLRA